MSEKIPTGSSSEDVFEQGKEIFQRLRERADVGDVEGVLECMVKIDKILVPDDRKGGHYPGDPIAQKELREMLKKVVDAHCAKDGYERAITYLSDYGHCRLYLTAYNEKLELQVRDDYPTGVKERWIALTGQEGKIIQL